jgi:hypothetical protein
LLLSLWFSGSTASSSLLVSIFRLVQHCFGVHLCFLHCLHSILAYCLHSSTVLLFAYLCNQQWGGVVSFFSMCLHRSITCHLQHDLT